MSENKVPQIEFESAEARQRLVVRAQKFAADALAHGRHIYEQFYSAIRDWKDLAGVSEKRSAVETVRGWILQQLNHPDNREMQFVNHVAFCLALVTFYEKERGRTVMPETVKSLIRGHRGNSATLEGLVLLRHPEGDLTYFGKRYVIHPRVADNPMTGDVIRTLDRLLDISWRNFGDWEKSQMRQMLADVKEAGVLTAEQFLGGWAGSHYVRCAERRTPDRKRVERPGGILFWEGDGNGNIELVGAFGSIAHTVRRYQLLETVIPLAVLTAKKPEATGRRDTMEKVRELHALFQRTMRIIKIREKKERKKGDSTTVAVEATEEVAAEETVQLGVPLDVVKTPGTALVPHGYSFEAEAAKIPVVSLDEDHEPATATKPTNKSAARSFTTLGEASGLTALVRETEPEPVIESVLPAPAVAPESVQASKTSEVVSPLTCEVCGGFTAKTPVGLKTHMRKHNK